MNIFEVLKNVRKEAYSRNAYKALKPMKELLFVSMLPVIAVCYLLYVFLAFGGLLLKVFGCPRDYVLKFVQDASEREKIKPGSQAVMYFFGFPIVLLLSIPYVFVYSFVFIGFFIFEVLVYLATLGGINYQPFLLDFNLDLPIKEIKRQRDIPQTVVAILSFLLFFVGYILVIVYAAMPPRKVDLIVHHLGAIFLNIRLVLTFIYAVCISRGKGAVKE